MRAGLYPILINDAGYPAFFIDKNVLQLEVRMRKHEWLSAVTKFWHPLYEET